MGLALKAVIGALAVVLIALCSRSKNYYLAGLEPMFPRFVWLTHYIVGRERALDALRHTLLYGLWAIIPYLSYLLLPVFLARTSTTARGAAGRSPPGGIDPTMARLVSTFLRSVTPSMGSNKLSLERWAWHPHGKRDAQIRRYGAR